MRYAILAALLISAPANAAPEWLSVAFEDGRYSDAASEAEAAQTADSLAFAARCKLAEAMSNPDFEPPIALVFEAEALARRALELEARHIEGRLQLAIALSLRARPLSTRQAMRSGFGHEAKALVEAVLEDDPDNFYAHGFMAVWHIEVVRRGGSVGSAVMGASVRKGRRHYEAALAINSDDASTHWQYARALTALNAKKYRADIDTALISAITVDAPTALDRVMQDRARDLAQAITTQPRRDVEALAEHML
ncbi:MAG: hypothetical protein AAGJ85_02985 [Pseudomonadota bacterium]